MRPHTNLPIPNLSSPMPLNPLLNPPHPLFKSHLDFLPVTPHPNIPPRNPKLDEPKKLFRQHQKLHLIPRRIMFGMTAQRVSPPCVRGEGPVPAVTGVTGHDTKVIGEEFLFSDPFGDDGSEC